MRSRRENGRLTEEYGSAALIERFAFDDMSAREFVLAFPYCLPGIGEPVVNWAFGQQAMARFVYYKPESFFHIGRPIATSWWRLTAGSIH